MKETWAYIKPYNRQRCPCGEIGAAVLEGGSDRCLSHGHMGFPEAFRSAREQGIRVVVTDDQMEWLAFQLTREGLELKPGWTAYDAIDALDKPRND